MTLSSIIFLSALGHLCGMLIVQGLNPMFDLYPDPIIVISVIYCVSPFFCPVPSHSCDPLEDLLPSLSQHDSISVLPDDKDLEFWWSYLKIHFHHWWIPLLQLSMITYLLTNCWILSMFDFSLQLFTWLGLYRFFGIVYEDLSSVPMDYVAKDYVPFMYTASRS